MLGLLIASVFHSLHCRWQANASHGSHWRLGGDIRRPQGGGVGRNAHSWCLLGCHGSSRLHSVRTHSPFFTVDRTTHETHYNNNNIYILATNQLIPFIPHVPQCPLSEARCGMPGQVMSSVHSNTSTLWRQLISLKWVLHVYLPPPDMVHLVLYTVSALPVLHDVHALVILQDAMSLLTGCNDQVVRVFDVEQRSSQYMQTNMHARMHAHTHTHIHTCKHTHAHTYAHANIHTCKHPPCTHTHTRTHTHTHTHTPVTALTTLSLFPSLPSSFSHPFPLFPSPPIPFLYHSCSSPTCFLFSCWRAQRPHISYQSGTVGPRR